MTIQVGDAATWVAAVVAFLALVFAAYERRSANRSEDANRELSARNEELERQRYRLETRAWVDQHFQAVQNWADRVCLLLSEACHQMGSWKGEDPRHTETLAKLSGLIDIGRWHFPNTDSETIGTEKEPAYRGYRQPVLDYVVDAYDALTATNSIDERKRLVVHLQRLFVSDIQVFLDPRRRETEIKSYLDRITQTERSVEKVKT